ncbi:hypothetical protein [Cohnella silvisoli]|uniref:Uncharacterized protein n=1 Tax=Cohnella silvisoli TaxID=2873699 RepID=A0ABV1KV22_9BACL|nr:hypothetical protein [Cohnella silvisoli]MCD9022992.1 hypothetical protein [Cohnella silvisoli]
MEQLISFVMKNLGIVIFVIGIIYALFFRKSPLERPPNRMPDFGGGGQQRRRGPGESRPPVAPTSQPEPVEARFPAPQRQTPPPAPRQQPVRLETRLPEPRSEINPTSSYTFVETEDMYAIEAQPKRAARSQTKATASSHSMRSDAPLLARDDLKRAVLWAEILGPPRARRPYRR